MFKVFLSSNQTEFAKYRQLIKEEFEKDFFLKSLFDVFLFEDSPSSGLSPENTFLEEVRKSDVYIGLIGSDYGTIKENGLSATEEEYDEFHASNENSFFYIQNVDKRDEKSEEFILKIQPDNKYTFFDDELDLIDEIKKSLVKFIEEGQKENDNFDKKLILNSSIDDIDDESYKLFFDLLKEDDSYVKLKDMDDKAYPLERIGAGENVNGAFHFNNAGALFFARNVNKFLSHEIKMVRFKGTTKFNAIDRVDLHAPLLECIKEFEKFFKRNTNSGFYIEGFNRINVDEYPIKAVREGFINALAHRNYERSSSFIEFYIFDDRIEIISPGKLKYPLTIEDIKKDEGIGHRNERICEIFYKTNYMEHIGRGISQMRDEMIKFGLDEPEFSEGNDSFKVVFKADGSSLSHDNERKNIVNLKDLGLNQRQIDIVTLITNNDASMTYDDHLNMFGKSKPTAERDFSKLVKLNLIKRNKLNKHVYFTSPDA